MSEKNVLFLCPHFYGYYKDIVEEFKAMGYEADYICDAPSNSNLSKAMGRVNKSLIHRSTETFFSRSVLPIIKQKTYDLIFLVAGMTFAFSVDMMKCLKKLLNLFKMQMVRLKLRLFQPQKVMSIRMNIGAVQTETLQNKTI